jgi:hypothetical protein
MYIQNQLNTFYAFNYPQFAIICNNFGAIVTEN